MKITSAIFRGSSHTFETCPPSYLPEFAFVGRSNVGKSSLINMLTGRNDLAKTSSVPGKTRLINFFEINAAWRLVDLPGYGFAKVSKSQQHEFNINVSAYLTERENLKHIFALVDSRLEPQESDLAFIQWIAACKLPYSIIFTKTDKQSDQAVTDHAQQFLQQLEAWDVSAPSVFSCSAKTSRGRSQILHFIEQHIPKKKKKSDGPRISLGWMNKR